MGCGKLCLVNHSIIGVPGFGDSHFGFKSDSSLTTYFIQYRKVVVKGSTVRPEVRAPSILDLHSLSATLL